MMIGRDGLWDGVGGDSIHTANSGIRFFASCRLLTSLLVLCCIFSAMFVSFDIHTRIVVNISLLDESLLASYSLTSAL